MSNYNGTTKSNYFKVNDEEKFRGIISRTTTDNGEIEIFVKEEDDGTKLFGFGCYGIIGGITPVEGVKTDSEFSDEDGDYDSFIRALQTVVADGDAVLIFEAGNEKLKSVEGYCAVVTAQKYVNLSLCDLGMKKAKEVLNNPDWDTQCNY